jgi:membrane protein DedA with SNARE-associated domain
MKAAGMRNVCPCLMVDWLETLSRGSVYAIVGLLVALESMGLPLPGETVLLAAAAYAALGAVSLPGVIAAATLGAIVGDSLGYWLGRRGGLPLLERYGRWIHLDRRRLGRAQAFLRRHGGKTVFLGRFTAFLRMFAAFLAGVARMPYGEFVAYNVSGGVCWALAMGLLGYALGHHLALLDRTVRWLTVGAGAVALSVAIFAYGRRRKLTTTVTLETGQDMGRLPHRDGGEDRAK